MRAKHLKVVFLTPLVILLASCASTPGTVDQCHNINWHRLGYQDGVHGKDKSNLQQAFADCGPNLVINKTAYDKGWNQGIRLYCTSRNGLTLGMQGKLYNNICPSHQASAFDKAWHEGIRDYCIPSNGFKRGLEGTPFPGYCPPDQNLAFRRAYDRAYPIYQRLVKLKDEYDQLNTQVQNIQTDIKAKELALRELENEFTRQSFSPKKQYQIQKEKIAIKRLASKADALIGQRDAIKQKYTDIETHNQPYLQ